MLANTESVLVLNIEIDVFINVHLG